MRVEPLRSVLFVPSITQQKALLIQIRKMIYFILLSTILVSSQAGIPLVNQLQLSLWNEFKQTNGKVYTTAAEENYRLSVFLSNLNYILDHNKQFLLGQASYQLKMNLFGDLTNNEFSLQMNGLKLSPGLNISQLINKNIFTPPLNFILPPGVDWRQQGLVTKVKDQQHCGSCWAFSAVGALEGQHFKQMNTLVELSEQNLIDCSKSYGNEGCGGGLMDFAFQYVKANGGVDTESAYPYEGKEGNCRFQLETVGANDTGFVDIEEGNEHDLQAAIATVGPISVAIDASHPSFQFYSKGVYDESECSSTELDHGVLAVGFGSTDLGQQYYIVKNSWGETWGDEGYILMSRGKSNQCGIATAASYPTV